MKARALLLSTLLSAFLIVAVACEDTNGTETPDGGDGTGTPGIGTTEPTATSPIGGGTETPGIGTETPGIGTPDATASPGGGTGTPGIGTPDATASPGSGTPGIGTPDATASPGTGTVTPGIGTPDATASPGTGTVTPGIGTPDATASPGGTPSGTAVPLGNVVFVPLEGTEGAAESGAAILVPMGDTTLVAIGIETSLDLEADAGIYQGSCEQLGDVETPLAAVQNSNSLTIVEMRAQELMDQDLAIVLTETGGTGADAIVCGDIP